MMEKLSNSTYVDRADGVIQGLIEKDRSNKAKIGLTTSQLRNLLSLISDIYNDVVHSQNKELTDEQMSRIQYLRVRFIYTAGREKEVKKFVEKAGIIDCLNNIGKDKQEFILFCRYMEALVAFHKFHGGID